MQSNCGFGLFQEEEGERKPAFCFLRHTRNSICLAAHPSLLPCPPPLRRRFNPEKTPSHWRLVDGEKH
jgi:hypothetical protein